MGKDRPILWSTGMVDVIMNTKLDTEPAAIDPEKPFKGVTRRIIGDTVGQRFTEAEHDGDVWGFSGPGGSAVIRAPYQAGDRLWGRERFAFESSHDSKPPREIAGLESPGMIWYGADEDTDRQTEEQKIFWRFRGKWRPGMFMPKRFTRIWHEITAVRAERLHQITPEDIVLEGLGDTPSLFSSGWQTINGHREGGAWGDNPWVWVVSFKRISPKT